MTTLARRLVGIRKPVPTLAKPVQYATGRVRTWPPATDPWAGAPLIFSAWELCS